MAGADRCPSVQDSKSNTAERDGLELLRPGPHVVLDDVQVVAKQLERVHGIDLALLAVLHDDLHEVCGQAGRIPVPAAVGGLEIHPDAPPLALNGAAPHLLRGSRPETRSALTDVLENRFEVQLATDPWPQVAHDVDIATRTVQSPARSSGRAVAARIR